MLQRKPQTGSIKITFPEKDSFGLPARYSSARIGLEPPVRETAARVAHVALPGAMPGAAVLHKSLSTSQSPQASTAS